MYCNNRTQIHIEHLEIKIRHFDIFDFPLPTGIINTDLPFTAYEKSCALNLPYMHSTGYQSYNFITFDAFSDTQLSF